MIYAHQENTRLRLLIQHYLTVAIVGLGTIVQEDLLVIFVHQESTRLRLLIQHYLTVAIVALAITVLEDLLEQNAALVNTRHQFRYQQTRNVLFATKVSIIH